MASFGVTSIFTNVSVDKTIEIILERELKQNKKKLPFNYIGTSFGNIFMVELERTILQSLNDKIKLWSCYVDDTIAFDKSDAIKNVLK